MAYTYKVALETLLADKDLFAANNGHHSLANRLLYSDAFANLSLENFTLYLTIASFPVTLAHLAIVLWRKKEHQHEPSLPDPALGSPHERQKRLIYASRFVGCLILVGTAASMLLKPPCCESMASFWILFGVFLYSSILSAGTCILSPQFAAALSFYLSTLHLLIFSMLTYALIVPLAIERHSSFLRLATRYDIANWITWIDLLYTGIITPLIFPRDFDIQIPEDDAKKMLRETASYLSCLFYFYMEPLVRLAQRKPTFVLEDLPILSPSDTAEYIKRSAFHKLDPKRRSLLISLFAYYKKELACIFALDIIQVVNDFSGPIAILRILSYLEAVHREGLIRPWVWTLWLAIGPIIASAAIHLHVSIETRIMVRTEVLLIQMIYDHTLRVRLNTASTDPEDDQNFESKTDNSTPSSPSSSSQNTVDENQENGNSVKTDTSKKVSQQAGRINNLVTVDMKNIVDGIELQFVFYFVRIVIALVMLYNILGWSALVGAAILVLALPFPGYIVKLRQSIQKSRMKAADSRLALVSQTMAVLRTVKLFGWVSQVEKKIWTRRDDELHALWKSQVIDVSTSLILGITPLVSLIGTYACFTKVMGLPLTASLIFSSISLFNIIQNMLGRAAFTLPFLIQGKTSLDRVAAFLKSGDILSHSTTESSAASNGLIVRETEFRWSKEETRLSDRVGSRRFSLHIEDSINFVPGRINLITGPTGSGKTCFLMSLLGELVSSPLSSEGTFNLPREGGVAYVPQESWILNDTVRNNILFGSECIEERYKQVIFQTALEKDFETFEGGDLTEVGERGVTLSGGQKARITLARALYSKAQVLLMDDILAALDAHTARWIVDKCLGGSLLKDRTVVLVTHNVLLTKPLAAHVVDLGPNGSILSHGPVEMVLQMDPSLSSTEATKELENIQSAVADPGTENTGKHEVARIKGKLTVAEEVAIGRVKWSAFKLYLTGFGGVIFFTFCVWMQVVQNAAPILQTWFLAYWSSQYEVRPTEDVPVNLYLGIYALLAVATSLVQLACFVCNLVGRISASRTIHQQLIQSILTSTFRWLDTVPVSRVMARCSQDTAAVDNNIGAMLFAVIQTSMTVVMNSITVVVVSGWEMFFPAFAIVACGIIAGQVYIKAQLPVKRLMSNARSPLLGHIQATLLGVVSVRAYGVQASFQKELERQLDSYSRIAQIYWDLNRWIGVRIDILGSVFSGVLAFWMIYGRPMQPGMIGFSLTLISTLNKQLLYLVRFFNEFEVQANSLERIRDFLLIDHEPVATERGIPPAYWPASGKLYVKDLSAWYSIDGPQVLRDVSLNAESGERIAIVGRTGAGKSTLGLALLRAVPTTGSVMLDGLDTSGINLDVLRYSISIIPQSPDLLVGTVRDNLDPMDEVDDGILNEALRAAGLEGFHSSSITGTDENGFTGSTKGKQRENQITLESKVEDGGSNFSLGQRQIIALARAFVRRSKVLIMDEATAAIDFETDALIQGFIRKEFRDVTVITIAHRLRTIMDYDKIMVLDNGRVAEWGTPRELLSDETGAFRLLVDNSPDKEELYAIGGSLI